jgi:riboflavin synthase
LCQLDNLSFGRLCVGMFTGIIQEIGEIKEIKNGEWVYYTIGLKTLNKDLKIGSSVAVDGICLTVLEFSDQDFTVQVMPETVQKTNLSLKTVGSKLNLEPSLKIGDTLDGHFVMGHVDGVGEVQNIAADGDYWVVSILSPVDLSKYIAQKGSVAINGTSLTVSKKSADSFEVSLIKHTLENTNLGDLKPGDKVNLEIDMFARYLENFVRS